MKPAASRSRVVKPGPARPAMKPATSRAGAGRTGATAKSRAKSQPAMIKPKPVMAAKSAVKPAAKAPRPMPAVTSRPGTGLRPRVTAKPAMTGTAMGAKPAAAKPAMGIAVPSAMPSLDRHKDMLAELIH